MKLSTVKEHRDFFQKNGWIEFEEFLSQDQLKILNQTIDQVLADRMAISSEKTSALSSEKAYLQGRDLWRGSSILQKFVTQRRFAEVVAELIEKKPLRLGYDQFFPFYQAPHYSQESTHIYSEFLSQPFSLEEASCLQGVVCGMMISLGGGKWEEEEDNRGGMNEGISIFPTKKGHALFFRPDLPINWTYPLEHPGERFLLIVYTAATTHYKVEGRDPHTHALKRLGYIFNDRLNDKLHPIVIR